MLFWIICAVLAVAVAMTVVVPMLRKPPAPQDKPDVAFYKAQLAEVDRDVTREVLAPDEAERAKVEIARRLLAAATAAEGRDEASFSTPVALVTGLGVIALTAGLYWQMGAPGYPDLPLQTRIANGDAARADRPGQAQAEAAAPKPPAPDAEADYLESVAQLRILVPTRPDDLQGWQLLVRHETVLRNYTAATAAQERVIALLGDAATPADRVALIDLMVAAANGYVSPEAEALTRAVLAEDENNLAARYYLGAMYNQTDRPDIAFRLWREIVSVGSANQFHVAFARSQVEDAAFRAGVDYTLPEVRGPSAEDIANAQDMTPADRQAMIANMVAGLSDRLASEGGPVTDWARLITAYGVLGEVQTAREILAEARGVFGASPEAMAVLDAAGAGLPE